MRDSLRAASDSLLIEGLNDGCFLLSLDLLSWDSFFFAASPVCVRCSLFICLCDADDGHWLRSESAARGAEPARQ